MLQDVVIGWPRFQTSTGIVRTNQPSLPSGGKRLPLVLHPHEFYKQFAKLTFICKGGGISMAHNLYIFLEESQGLFSMLPTHSLFLNQIVDLKIMEMGFHLPSITWLPNFMAKFCR